MKINNGIISEKKLVIPLLGVPGVRLSKTSLKQNLTHSETQYKTLSMLTDKFEPDGIFPIMDLTVEVEALGLRIDFPENNHPSVINHPIKTKIDLDALKGNWNGITGRMRIFSEIIEKIAKKYSILTGGYVIGPFSMAGELMGAHNTALNIILNPELVLGCIEFSLQVITEYTRTLFNAGADTIAVLEPLAVILSPEQYKEFSLKPFQKLVSNLDNRPLILHICGNTNHIIKLMCDSGAIGFSLDSDVNFKELKKSVPKEIALIGNLAPVDVFLRSTPEGVAKATKNLTEDMKDSENFILSSGCDIPMDTPLENIEAFMKAARERNRTVTFRSIIINGKQIAKNNFLARKKND